MSKTRAARAILAFISLLPAMIFLACSRPSQSSLLGTWKAVDRGMSWEWRFDEDGSFAWAILGQTDMGGRPVDIRGSGGYTLEAGTLTLRFEPFSGVTGIYPSQAAAPGYDARTLVTLKLSGRTAMLWRFESAALGPAELSLARSR